MRDPEEIVSAVLEVDFRAKDFIMQRGPVERVRKLFDRYGFSQPDPTRDVWEYATKDNLWRIGMWPGWADVAHATWSISRYSPPTAGNPVASAFAVTTDKVIKFLETEFKSMRESVDWKKRILGDSFLDSFFDKHQFYRVSPGRDEWVRQTPYDKITIIKDGDLWSISSHNTAHDYLVWTLVNVPLRAMMDQVVILSGK